MSPASMKPTTAALPAAHRPNRILVMLAVAWMILSLAIGGAMAAETPSSANSQVNTITSVTQP